LIATFEVCPPDARRLVRLPADPPRLNQPTGADGPPNPVALFGLTSGLSQLSEPVSTPATLFNLAGPL